MEHLDPCIRTARRTRPEVTAPASVPRSRPGAGPSVGSRMVDWWEVHTFVEAVRAQLDCGPIPEAGTPDWQALADGDPRKLLACAESGVHWALRRDTAQAAAADASKAIASAADWGRIARDITQRQGVHIRRIPESRTA